jgi:hypothetical protein
MKYFKVIFSDYSETIGTYKTKTEAEKGARHYCKIWNLDIVPREVIEISESEYNSLKR